jgi:hypothetical protein
MTPTGEDFKLLGYLAKINTGVGTKTQAMLDYFDEHGELPATDLHEMGLLLSELSERLLRRAKELNRPVLEAGP